MRWLKKPRQLGPNERKVTAAAGIAALAGAFSLMYFDGREFAFLALLMALVGLMWIVWASFGKDY